MCDRPLFKHVAFAVASLSSFLCSLQPRTSEQNNTIPIL